MIKLTVQLCVYTMIAKILILSFILQEGSWNVFYLQEEEYDVPEELEDIIGWFTSYCLKT